MVRDSPPNCCEYSVVMNALKNADLFFVRLGDVMNQTLDKLQVSVCPVLLVVLAPRFQPITARVTL